MAATSQQGTFLGTTLVGFTTLFAGLAGYGGVLATLVGLALLIVSAAGFYKAKTV